MTLQDQIRNALANVGRRKLRSALASLGVVVGTLTIVIMVSLAAGVRQQINRQFASIGLDRLTVTPPGTGRRGGFGPPGFDLFGMIARKKIITAEDVSGWKELPGVIQVIPEVTLPNSVGLEVQWNGTNQPVRMGGGEPMRGNIFQELPQPVAGSLELPESGGVDIRAMISPASSAKTWPPSCAPRAVKRRATSCAYRAFHRHAPAKSRFPSPTASP